MSIKATDKPIDEPDPQPGKSARAWFPCFAFRDRAYMRFDCRTDQNLHQTLTGGHSACPSVFAVAGRSYPFEDFLSPSQFAVVASICRGSMQPRPVLLPSTSFCCGPMQSH